MKIILNADDFGMTHEANLGIEKAMQEGYCSQTSVVANTNYFDEAVEIAQKHGFMDKVGLHINLFDGTPLTGGIKNLRNMPGLICLITDRGSSTAIFHFIKTRLEKNWRHRSRNTKKLVFR